jgi:hypothetical protein
VARGGDERADRMAHGFGALGVLYLVYRLLFLFVAEERDLLVTGRP